MCYVADTLARDYLMTPSVSFNHSLSPSVTGIEVTLIWRTSVQRAVHDACKHQKFVQYP